MRVTLHVLTGASAGRRIYLFSGQVGRFGRTEWSDFAFPDDTGLAEIHFAVQCAPAGPRLRDLQSELGTRLNGKPVTEATMRSGDEIAAGATRFRVEIDGQPPGSAGRPDTPPTDQARDSGKDAQTAARICANIDLEEDAQSLLTKEQSPREFTDLLSEHRLWRDGIRFAAARLPRKDGILWGCRCLRESLGQRLSHLEVEAIQTAEHWARQPDENLRREAERLAEQDAHSSPAAWLAMTAFWSGDSLAAPDAEPVPPAPHLAPTALATALLLAVAETPPLEVDRQLERFLAKIEEGDGETGPDPRSPIPDPLIADG